MTPQLSLKNTSGIYVIENRVNGKIYVGRTKCFYRRCHQYLYDFKFRGLGHINDHLFNSMRKYGIESFDFRVIEFCDPEVGPERELFWIRQLRSCDRLIGYNLRLDVGGKMVAATSTKEKISNRLRKEWRTGKRSGHSNKLKEAWAYRDREKQSNLMSNTLTKYVYIVTHLGLSTEMKFKTLAALGLDGVLSSFHKSKSDRALFKGVEITRRRI